jgi:hypothetical protein
VGQAVRLLISGNYGGEQLRRLTQTVLNLRIVGDPNACIQTFLYREELDDMWSYHGGAGLAPLATLVGDSIAVHVDELSAIDLLAVIEVLEAYGGDMSWGTAAAVLRRLDTLSDGPEQAMLAAFVAGHRPVLLAVLAKAVAHEPAVVAQLVSVCKMLNVTSEGATVDSILTEAIGALTGMADVPSNVLAMLIDAISSRPLTTIYASHLVMNFLRGMFKYDLPSAETAEIVAGFDRDKWESNMRTEGRSVASEVGFSSNHALVQFLSIFGDTPDIIVVSLIRLFPGIESQLPENSIYRLTPAAKTSEGEKYVEEKVSIGLLLLRLAKCAVKPDSDNRAIILRLWQRCDPTALRDPVVAAALANCCLYLINSGTANNSGDSTKWAATGADVFLVGLASDSWRLLIERAVPSDTMSRLLSAALDRFMGLTMNSRLQSSAVIGTTKFYVQAMFDRTVTRGGLGPYSCDLRRLIQVLYAWAVQDDDRTRRLLSVIYVAHAVMDRSFSPGALAAIEGHPLEDGPPEVALATFMNEYDVDIPDVLFERMTKTIKQLFPNTQFTPPVAERLSRIANEGEANG